MRVAISLLIGSVIGALVAPKVVPGADWPQYRGPQRSGVAEGENLKRSWSDTEPRDVWRRPLGAGYSSIAVVDDRAYTMFADAEGEYVVALATADGNTVWQFRVGDFVDSELGDGGPRSTPTVADGIVYTVSSQSKLIALRASSGTVIWEVDLSATGPVPRFGYSMSPLVANGQVIVEMGKREEGPGVTAFDRVDGSPVWSALTGPAGYSSPIAVTVDGQRQYVFFRSSGREIVGLSPTGEIAWRHATPEALSAISTPIFAAPDRFFVSTSEDAFGGRMFRLEMTEEGIRVAPLWQERLMRNHFSTSVVVDRHLFGFDNGTLRCLNAATGEKLWARRGFGKGSLIAADGMLLVLSDSGVVALARADPDGYQEAGRRQVMEGRAWTSPSLANGRLYVRDFDEIVSLEVGGAGDRSSSGPDQESEP